MSWVDVYDLFTDRCTAKDCKEWEEPFDDQNIPATLIDRAFQQRTLSISGDSLSNKDFVSVVNHQVVLYFKGFREPKLALREGLTKAQEIISYVLSHRYGFKPSIQSVQFLDAVPDPLSDVQNDNIIAVRITFAVRVNICLE